MILIVIDAIIEDVKRFCEIDYFKYKPNLINDKHREVEIVEIITEKKVKCSNITKDKKVESCKIIEDKKADPCEIIESYELIKEETN